MKTYVVTVIYYNAKPIAYIAVAESRGRALWDAWGRYMQVADHIKKIVAVAK
jgi:hypothetical protein